MILTSAIIKGMNEETVQENSMLERQILRLLCFIVGGYCIASSIQLFIGYAVLHFDSWINQTVAEPAVIYALILAPLVTGSVLILGKILHRQKIILYGLFLTWVFHLGMALLNGVAYKGLGTPMLPYLMVGLTAALLYGYYGKRHDLDQGRDKELLL